MNLAQQMPYDVTTSLFSKTHVATSSSTPRIVSAPSLSSWCILQWLAGGKYHICLIRASGILSLGPSQVLGLKSWTFVQCIAVAVERGHMIIMSFGATHTSPSEPKRWNKGNSWLLSPKLQLFYKFYNTFTYWTHLVLLWLRNQVIEKALHTP